jgi:hypothetical protein
MTTLLLFIAGLVLLSVGFGIWWNNLDKLAGQADPDCEAPLLAEELEANKLEYCREAC